MYAGCSPGDRGALSGSAQRRPCSAWLPLLRARVQPDSWTVVLPSAGAEEEAAQEGPAARDRAFCCRTRPRDVEDGRPAERSARARPRRHVSGLPEAPALPRRVARLPMCPLWSALPRRGRVERPGTADEARDARRLFAAAVRSSSEDARSANAELVQEEEALAATPGPGCVCVRRRCDLGGRKQSSQRELLAGLAASRERFYAYHGNALLIGGVRDLARVYAL